MFMRTSLLILLSLFSCQTVEKKIIQPANPNATENARKVLNYLYNLPHGESNRIISGHLAGGAVGPEVPDEAGGSYRFTMKEINYIHQVSGQWVGLIGADYCAGFIDFPNPLHSQMYYKDVNKGLMDYWDAGGLVIITTHQFDPRELYTDGGQCFRKQLKKGMEPLDIRRLYTPGTQEYENFRVIMDRWSEGLQELQDHGVVVLWRPYNEITNSGKWWCRQPAEPFKALYRYTFNYMTKVKKLNNLLWVYDAREKPKLELNMSHYPGDQYVDIVGVTMNWDSGTPPSREHPYPKKVFGFVEFNVVSRPRLRENETKRDYDYMKKFNWIKENAAYATFFMSWNRIWGPYGRGTPESLKKMYNDPWVINRGEIHWEK